MASNPSVLELQQTLYRSKNATRRWLHCTRRDWITAALHEYAPRPCARAMEVGPGSGVYLPTLLTLADQVVAVDVEDAFLEQARALSGEDGRLQTIQTDIRAPDLPKSSFDLILCSEVIEHIAGSAEALRQMSALLKPGGVLVLSTPHKWSLLELTGRIAFHPAIIQIARRIYKEPVLPPGHINLLTRAQVERQLREAGLVICKHHASGMYMPLVAELGGEAALHLQQTIEKMLRGGSLEQLLWTQYYVARLSS